jgi:hypothetical protein
MKNQQKLNPTLRHILNLRRGDPGHDLGSIDLYNLHVYVSGYRHCLMSIGLPADLDDFYKWLLKKYNKTWGPGWVDVLLEQTHGEHLSALELFISVVSEYMRAGGFVDTEVQLDQYDRKTRDRVLRDILGIRNYRLGSYVGEANLYRLPAYISGYRACLADVRLPDDFPEFEQWLLKKNSDMQQRDWVTVFLERARGDHLSAVELLLSAIDDYLTEQQET